VYTLTTERELVAGLRPALLCGRRPGRFVANRAAVIFVTSHQKAGQCRIDVERIGADTLMDDVPGKEEAAA